MYKNEFYPMLA